MQYVILNNLTLSMRYGFSFTPFKVMKFKNHFILLPTKTNVENISDNTYERFKIIDDLCCTIDRKI